MFVYAVTIFTGAFLLFQVQPLIGKYILPWFGGAPGVWTTCLLFFQVMLLGGYAYAHLSSRWLKPHVQAIGHLVLLFIALALLPITPADSWKPTGGENPTGQILVLLTVCIGLPYFVLSSTGPLMQHWFSRTNPGVSPYRLYALSNIGSLLALISFPFFFETHFTRKTQAALWGWGLAVYAIGCAGCAIKLWKTRTDASPVTVDLKEKSGGGGQALIKFLWLLLPACASLLLLATTNKICQEVAVIPFLWVLPLALYLLSFILCFDNPRWYARLPFLLALTAAWGGVVWILFLPMTISVPGQIGIYCSCLFICCMVCHGELYRLRPEPQHLTGFYLLIAAGGALGGLFVAVIAPLMFTDYFELQWGLLLGGLLLLLIQARDRNPGRGQRWRWPAGIYLSAALVALGIALWRQAQQPGSQTVERTRNFYGVLKVLKYDSRADVKRGLLLVHGRTWHGLQFRDPPQSAWPTLYYSENSGVGLALRALPEDRRRIGVIGLGTGTIATYARAGDYVHFYEINPEVRRLATSRFSYLSNCAAKVEITLGDARLSLEGEKPQNFDLLVLDAFSSDAIPVHLLTEEAFKIYGRHLKTNGLIAVHVSNRSLNLEPVVAKLARRFNFELATIDYDTPRDQPWILRSIWMLLSHNQKIMNSSTLRRAARPEETGAKNIPLWTDDFASLFQILRLKAARIDPHFSVEQTKKAYDLCQRGDYAGAVAVYHAALQTHPDSPELLNNLAWLLATCPDARIRNGDQAVQSAMRACELTHYGATPIIGTLAAAQAEAGKFNEAVATAQMACDLAVKNGETNLLQKNQELLERYRLHQTAKE